MEDDDEAALVRAARAGDRHAAERLIAAHLPMLYRVVGRALDQHADVDDVVQETVLRVHRDLPYVRTPERFRSWLMAIALHQISTRQRAWRLGGERRAGLDEAADVADPAADFTGATPVRLDLSAQRRQVAVAARWLDPDARSLLPLWWREVAGELDRPGVVARLGLGAAHVRVRIKRMRHQLDVSRNLVAALGAEPRCPGLDEAARQWDGTPSPRWRKRFARHLRGCDRCAGVRSGFVPLDRLLSGVSALSLPSVSGAAGAHLAGAKVAAVLVLGATTAAGLHAGLTDDAPGAVIEPVAHPDSAVTLARDRLVVTGGASGARFTVVPGVADGTCLSLRTRDGRYVRHSSFRLVLGEDDGLPLFEMDATFCPRPGAGPGGVRLASFNYPGRFLRVRDDELWLDPEEPGAGYLRQSTFRITTG